MSYIAKLLMKMGLQKALVRRVAALVAGALIVFAPELGLESLTETIVQILSGVVVWLAGSAEVQLGSKKE